MSARWACLIIFLVISRAPAQEIEMPMQEARGERALAEKIGELYDTTLPALLIKKGVRKCEYFQFRVDCLDIAMPKVKLINALKSIQRSFDRRSLEADEGVTLLQAYVEGETFKRKTTVKFAILASPVPPAIPFAAYDGKKSDYFAAIEKEDDLVKKGQEIKESERDPYLKKLGGKRDDPGAAGFDPRFDKGLTIAEALARAKSAGFDFLPNEFDEFLGLEFLGYRRSADVAGADIAIQYWNEFYDRSMKRELSWKDDCQNCAIVTKISLGPNASYLQYCEIQIAAGKKGAPENCFPVVYSLPNGVWLRTAFTFEYPDGLGGIDSGYRLECKPLNAGLQPLTLDTFMPDIKNVMQELDYIYVNSDSNFEQKFVNEFGQSKLFPDKHEWTTVTAGVIYSRAKTQPLDGFSLALNVNFSLRPEQDQTKYRAASVPEETDGLRRLVPRFRDKYSCAVVHEPS